MATRRKKPAKKRSGKSLFKVASSNKAYKAAKKALAKAEARSKKAWKKAVTVAKRKIKSKR